MRRALTDHARARLSAKRGEGITLLSLHEDVPNTESQEAIEILALDEALNRLAKMDIRKVQIVELRFFGGLTAEEIAGLLETTPDSIRSQWRLAKVWLFRELSGQT
jgi:RNA polymerase sigma factor (TIGR02999 family)